MSFILNLIKKLMNTKNIILLLIFLSLVLLSIIIISLTSESMNSSDELFDVDSLIQSELENNIFKVKNTGQLYDRYLTESDYTLYRQSILLDDAIIKYQFTEQVTIDSTVSNFDNSNVIVIYPTFTSAAYSEPGFYTYFAGKCNESCITDLSFATPELKFSSSGMTTQLLRALGYNFISDVDVDKNPIILKNYETVILLHNEYVTKKMFDAITSHPNLIFLFPNALYAEIEVNHQKNTMTLIKGHDYPPGITNGFNYDIEQKFHQYEFDYDCLTPEFFKFENGYALNCYPDAVIWDRTIILSQLKSLTLVD